MLHDLADDGGYGALKRAAEEREGWRHRERMLKNLLYSCCTEDHDTHDGSTSFKLQKLTFFTTHAAAAAASTS